MWISRGKYEELIAAKDDLQKVKKNLNENLLRLLEAENARAELQKEVERLSELINAENKDGMIGPWCKDCQHFEEEIAVFAKPMDAFTFTEAKDGCVRFCKKHIHSLCPDWEGK